MAETTILAAPLVRRLRRAFAPDSPLHTIDLRDEVRVRYDRFVAELVGERPLVPAAVLVPVVLHAEPTLLLTERTHGLKQHAGQIAFPGGRIDPDDDGPVGAALRETEEEVGLSRDAVEVIGLADPIRTGTGYEVTPVIGLVRPHPALTMEEAEVSTIFEAPLAYLLDRRNHRRVAPTAERPVPTVSIAWQDYDIWGVTALVIGTLCGRLEQTG